MLPKENRLDSNAIDSLKVGSKKYHSPFLTILYKKNDLSVPRFAIVVSKKVSKKATYRNSLKRQLRNQIRANIDLFKKNDFLIIVKKSADDKNYEKFCEDVEEVITFAANNL